MLNVNYFLISQGNSSFLNVDSLLAFVLYPDVNNIWKRSPYQLVVINYVESKSVVGLNVFLFTQSSRKL